MKSLDITMGLIRNRKEGRPGFKKIADMLNVSYAAVQLVAQRKCKSRRIMVAIAAALDKKPETVFPEEFKKAVNS